ncbi:hypothetical protein EBL89_03575 [Cereibacter sphaeroides]|uniref:hypothetical protein n=1 Tax=Cereibacter sphaeroides TaxID=1063 RepID=UPI000F545ED5|nr:hypothetical protein [Cereibacter sphaeroides]AZB54445.1 hypothetical protein EBL89_03575 [Cereibacter sphaeroides]AZB58699.1 hypothetical protein EBL88_03560 [Cereibacter sphaeroides]
MALYRKKPVVIEAEQFLGTMATANRVLAFIGAHGGNARRADNGKPEAGIIIPTREGDMLASPGDWIIRGVQGEFYPCKPEIFAATYDLAEG